MLKNISFIIAFIACEEPKGDLVVRIDDRNHLLSEESHARLFETLKEKANEWNECKSTRSIWVNDIDEPQTVPIIIVTPNDPHLLGDNGHWKSGRTFFKNDRPREIYFSSTFCTRIVGHELGHAFINQGEHSPTGVMSDLKNCDDETKVTESDCAQLDE